MKINWRKLNRVLHRDLGYFFTGMVIIYAVSGIALNHRNDWNPSYVITLRTESFEPTDGLRSNNKESILSYLTTFGEEKNYKSHYKPAPNITKVFLNDGSSLSLNFTTNQTTIETIRKRPLFHQINFLHYNPGLWWKWFSDLFCLALIAISLTGLFILKGKNGITRRGAWLVAAGLALPLLLLFIYY